MPVFHVVKGDSHCDLEVGMYESDFFELRSSGPKKATLQLEFAGGKIPKWLAIDVGKVGSPHPGCIQSEAQQGDYVISLRRNSNPSSAPSSKFTIHFDGQNLDPRIIPR
jgi:hypothetical protein